MHKWRVSDIKDNLKIKLFGTELTIRETSPNKFKIYGFNKSNLGEEYAPENITIVLSNLGAEPLEFPSEEVTMKHIFPGARFKRIGKNGDISILRLVTTDRLNLMPMSKVFGEGEYTLILEEIWDCAMTPLSAEKAIAILKMMGATFLEEK